LQASIPVDEALPGNQVIAIDDGVDDRDAEDGTTGITHSQGSHRKLTSAVWKEFT